MQCKAILISCIYLFSQSGRMENSEWKISETTSADKLFVKNSTVRFTENKALITNQDFHFSMFMIESGDRLLLKSGAEKRLFKKTLNGDTLLVLEELYVKTPNTIKLKSSKPE